MALKKICFLFCFLGCLSGLKGQEFLTYGPNYNLFGIPTYNFYDVEECSVEMTNVAITSSLILKDFSFTSFSADFIYSYFYNSNSNESNLFFNSFNSSSGYWLPTSTLRDRYFPDDEIRALTCDYFGHLYGAGMGISFYDATEDAAYADTPWNLPDEDFSSYLGNLPPDMQAGGALTYRQGKLFLTTINNTLVEVNTDDP